ncbi:hypothetical protein QFC19_002702 [Naganishia cerealis]|uniref:Uncharacterized protein n=1 Tax=Naganishia cerealis TaxID=610337 RepID=A0ACC2W834_9TREE|nr:hypothetical protein QFC19_002702 [Naganishia cerealis]
MPTNSAQPSLENSSSPNKASAMANGNDESERDELYKLSPNKLVEDVSSLGSAVSNNQAEVFPVFSRDTARGNVIGENLTATTVSQDSSPLTTEFDNKSITCEHGRLCPYQTRNVKVISYVSESASEHRGTFVYRV